MKRIYSALALMLLLNAAYSQTTYYVNDNSTSGDVLTSAVGNNANVGTAAAPFATLQYAVNSAAANDIIYVDAGTYTGQVTIDKGITIIGAGQTLTFITSSSQLVAPPGPFTEYALIQTTQGIGDVHISNLTATNGTLGDGHTIMIQTGGSVKNCKLVNGGQSVFFRIPDATIKNAVTENNIMEPTGIGVNCQGSGLTATIRNNTISKATSYYAGIFAGLDFGPLPQLTIQNNIINNFNGEGILAASFNGTYTLNSITGTGTNSINRNGNGGNTPIATCNWFGTSNAATVASKIIGTVIYTPFLTDGTDGSSNVGFQPLGSCGTGNTYYVNDNSLSGDVFTTAVGNNANAGTAAAPFATLQYAVNTAAVNDIIYVDAGTYTEQVTITKGITIIGAGQNATSILKPAIVAAPPVGPSTFNEPGVIQTAQNIGDVNIKDLSVTGDFTVNVTPIIIQSGGSVRNCKLQSGNQGLFVRVDPATNPSAKTFFAEGNIINAEYIAVNFAGGIRLTAFLTNNNISAFNPGFSSGTWAGTDFGTLNRLTITGNSFSSYVGDGAYINSNNCTISQNSFTGTGQKAINKFGGSTINATCNWYGVANAAAIVPKITAGVNYYPWYVDGTDASPAAGFQHYTESCGGGGNVFYVNDNSTTGDIFTTVIGNDANAGTSPTSPLATFDAALTKASPGATIYFDAGTYTAQNVTIGKSVTVIGTNYHVSPNSAANPLQLNSTCNAESIIDNSTWTIGADGIAITGLTFTPTGNAVVLNNTSFGNFNLSRNRVRINSLFPAFIFNGLSTVTTLSQIVNWGLSITENRFEKEDASSGVTIRVNRFGSVNIGANTFVVTGTTPRTQTCMVLGNAGIVAYASVYNNIFDKAGTGIGGNTWNYTNINTNKFINTGTAFNINNSYPESADVLFNNNTLDGSEGFVPFVQYTRQGGNTAGAKSSFTAEGNTITGSAVSGTTTLLGSMNLIFNNSVLSPSLTVRNNKITYGGDLSTVPSHFIRPIMLRGNLANAVVEKNEITLSGINQQPGNSAINLPYCPAITFYTDNGTTSFTQPGSVINILNNKINGFKHSFAAYDPLAGNDAYVGFGNIPSGVIVNINNNSFTGDSISINNGTVGQPVLATCNWYGSADAAVVVPKISGIATYSPWLSNGTDNDVARGFQPLPNVCNGRQNKFYVNDEYITGDVFTTAVGNDANSGIPSAPLLTLTAAYNKAQAGDTIYVDAGFYQTSTDITLNKSITFLGTNYQISPKDPLNPLQPNPARLTESVVVNHSFIIAAKDIRIKGFYFDPASKTQIQQTVTTNDFDNIEIEKNVFSIVSNSTSINITGKQVTPLVTINYSITDNRFVKEFGTGGTTISLNSIDAVQINNNVFTTNNLYFNNARIQTGIVVGALTGDILISNNNAYQQNFFINGTSAKKTTISFNSADECIRFVLAVSGNVNPNEIEITDNIVTNPRTTGGPVISYVRNNGTNLSTPNIARIERNTITLNATGLTSIAQSLIAPTLDAASANTQVFIRNNKLTITGDFSTLSGPTNYVSAIRFLTNSRYALIENNEMEFTAINYNINNKFGIGLLTSGLQPGTSFNFLNNKFSGFPTSIGVQNGGAYGQLPTGVILNINNNSFTGDVMSINNGTTGQSASANCNWYGSAAAQNFINKLSLSTVDIVPWLTNGTDNDAATGFQPVPGSCDGYPTLITLDSYTDVTCNGAANGSINITTTYGKAPFVYTWTKDGDAIFVSHDEDPTNLSPGTYHLALVDGNGSNIYITDENADGPGTIDVTITEPTVLNATPSGTNNLCFAESNGTASVLAEGGTAPYTYLWSNGATSSSISNLIAGNYSVTVTDDNGCTAQSNYVVTEPLVLSATATGTSTSCANSASVVALGGTAPYSYLWSNGATAQTITSLPAGTYTVTVTDAHGCATTASCTVIAKEAFNPSASVSDVSCFGGNNGSISITNVNATAPFQFSIDGVNFIPAIPTSSLQFTFSNLSAGTYTITVRDANGCTGFVTKTVNQPPLLSAVLNTVQSTCYGLSTGSISVAISGGTGALSYSWTGSNGFTATSKNISNLAAGNYSLTVTDNNGCTASLPVVVVPSFNQIIVNATVNDIICKAETNGSISLNVTGGTGNFSYIWSTGATTSIINNLGTGNKSVTITDIGSGCTFSRTYTINQPSLVLKLNIDSVINVKGCTAADLGKIGASASGGWGTYQFKIGNGSFQSSGLFTGLSAGTYRVYVKDIKGCTVFADVIIVDDGNDAYEGTGGNKNNTKGKAVQIALGANIAARIATTGDPADWYKFTTTAAGNYTVNFTHPSAAFVFNLYTSASTTPITTQPGSTATAKIYNLNAATTYYISITGGPSYVCYSLSAAPTLVTRMNTDLIVKENKPTTEKLNASVFPNPHRGAFGIKIESITEGTAIVEIMNSNGQLITEKRVSVNKGGVSIVNFTNMRHSILFYRVIIGNEVRTGKIIGPN